MSRSRNGRHQRTSGKLNWRLLPRGQINAVRAEVKADIKPSQIARQFGISQSDVGKVLASGTTTQKGT
jgi:hypothetical protein